MFHMVSFVVFLAAYLARTHVRLQLNAWKFTAFRKRRTDFYCLKRDSSHADFFLLSRHLPQHPARNIDWGRKSRKRLFWSPVCNFWLLLYCQIFLNPVNKLCLFALFSPFKSVLDSLICFEKQKLYCRQIKNSHKFFITLMFNQPLLNFNLPLTRCRQDVAET